MLQLNVSVCRPEIIETAIDIKKVVRRMKLSLISCSTVIIICLLFFQCDHRASYNYSAITLVAINRSKMHLLTNNRSSTEERILSM